MDIQTVFDLHQILQSFDLQLKMCQLHMVRLGSTSY